MEEIKERGRKYKDTHKKERKQKKSENRGRAKKSPERKTENAWNLFSLEVRNWIENVRNTLWKRAGKKPPTQL